MKNDSKSALDDLLDWEPSYTTQTNPYEGEFTVAGPIDGFVDRTQGFVEFSRQFGIVGVVQCRAQRFELLTGADTKLDKLRRLAIDPVAEASRHRGTYIGELARPRPAKLGDDIFVRRRRSLEVVGRDVDHVVALRESIDFMRWNPFESFKRLKKLLAYNLEPSTRENLGQLAKLINSLCREEEESAIWGCWLMLKCDAAEVDSPVAFKGLIHRLTDLHIAAIKTAARCVAKGSAPSLDGSRSEANEVSDTKSKPRAMLSYVDGKPAVRFNEKNCDVPRGKCESLLNVLYEAQANDLRLSYKTIFETVYRDDAYNPDLDAGAPDKLRQVAKRLNDALVKELGLPPNGKPWIRTSSGHGYYLTDAVTWQAKTDWQEHDFNKVKLTSGR